MILLKGVKVLVLLVQGTMTGRGLLNRGRLRRMRCGMSSGKLLRARVICFFFVREANDVNSSVEGFLKEQGYWIDSSRG